MKNVCVCSELESGDVELVAYASAALALWDGKLGFDDIFLGLMARHRALILSCRGFAGSPGQHCGELVLEGPIVGRLKLFDRWFSGSFLFFLVVVVHARYCDLA